MHDSPRMKDHTRTPKIAIVDDDQSIREALASLIEAFGFDVELFSSAEEFLSSIHLDHTDCLVLDIRMHGMSGLDLQSELAERNRCVPIIFLTAHGNQYQERQALRAGAVAFLRKPFSAVQMLRILESTLVMHEIEDGA
jgi:FixJ family two-component response regulator